MSHPRPSHFRHASFRGQIGLARVDITPPIGVYSRNWGAASHDVAESIHRNLTLTALSLTAEDGGPTLIFVDADLGWWKTPQTYQSFMSRLCTELQIDPQHMIFALSHTHSGPPLMEPDASLPGSSLLRDWQQDLLDKSVDAIGGLSANAFQGTLDWHTGRCGLAANRDLPDPDSTHSRYVCGFNPEQKADDTLLVGRVTDATGDVRATLTNYACHPTTLAWDNRAISPDYVGAMRETIEQATGGLSLFMLGACGELAPRNQYVSDPSIADQHGRTLAHSTLATLNNMEPPATALVYEQTVESGATLATWRHEKHSPSTVLRSVRTSVELPIKDWPSANELEIQRSACTDRAIAERLLRKHDIRQFLGDSSSYELQISVWRIGDAVLIGSCCEPYSILQTELRREFSDESIVCMNLINGSLGYLPPADLYDTEIYPVWQTPFDRGSLEKTVQAMTQAIHDIYSE